MGKPVEPNDKETQDICKHLGQHSHERRPQCCRLYVRDSDIKDKEGNDNGKNAVREFFQPLFVQLTAPDCISRAPFLHMESTRLFKPVCYVTHRFHDIAIGDINGECG